MLQRQSSEEKGTNLFRCGLHIKEKHKNRLPGPFGFYSNGNNECNRNELGRQLVYQQDAL